jgi:general secretion pathway protein L
MSLRGVRYKSKKLDLDIEIADLQTLDELKLRLVKEAGLQVEIISASAKGGKVDGRLQITAT